MGVELRAARLGVVEVAPGHEVDAPEPGSGGDRRQPVQVRRARRPAAARHRARRRRAPSRHPSGQVSPAACLATRTLCTTAKPTTITTSTTAWTARSTNAVARGAPWTCDHGGGQRGGTAAPAPRPPSAARPRAGTWSGPPRRSAGSWPAPAGPGRRRPRCSRGGTARRAAARAPTSATPRSSTDGNGQQDEHHGQLAQRVAALAPADGRLGQQVPAEDDGAEDDRLARHRHRGVRTAVAGVVPPDDEHVDVLEHRHHGQRHRGDHQVEDDRAPLRRRRRPARGRGAGPPPSPRPACTRQPSPPDQARTAT